MSYVLEVLEDVYDEAKRQWPPTKPYGTYKQQLARTARNMGKKAISSKKNKDITGHTLGLIAGAVNPTLGLVVKSLYKHFRDDMNEDTSQVTSSALYGYHPGFWSASSGPNSLSTVPVTQPTNPNNQDDKFPKKKKYYPDPRSRPREQDVANPAASASLIIGVDYGS
jgi:hypothetical protein